MNSNWKYSDWNGKIACQEMDKNLRLDTSQISTSANCFIFLLVDNGSCDFQFIRKRIHLSSGDVMVFPPTYPPRDTKTSEDYHATCLIVQRDFAYTQVSVLKTYQLLISTVVLEHSAKATPTPEHFQMLKDALLLIRRHMTNPHSMTDEAITSLYMMFLYDLTVCLKTMDNREAQRTSLLYVQFLELLNLHFKEHHDIPFYAAKLGISPRYLSMIIKKLTGDTVLHYINERIVMEACWMLKSTDKSILQISEELHFSDQASFSKFFKRNRNKNPLQYRKEEY